VALRKTTGRPGVKSSALGAGFWLIWLMLLTSLFLARRMRGGGNA
jgi:hypothetical protein